MYKEIMIQLIKFSLISLLSTVVTAIYMKECVDKETFRPRKEFPSTFTCEGVDDEEQILWIIEVDGGRIFVGFCSSVLNCTVFHEEFILSRPLLNVTSLTIPLSHNFTQNETIRCEQEYVAGDAKCRLDDSLIYMKECDDKETFRPRKGFPSTFTCEGVDDEAQIMWYIDLDGDSISIGICSSVLNCTVFHEEFTLSRPLLDVTVLTIPPSHNFIQNETIRCEEEGVAGDAKCRLDDSSYLTSPSTVPNYSLPSQINAIDSSTTSNSTQVSDRDSTEHLERSRAGVIIASVAGTLLVLIIVIIIIFWIHRKRERSRGEQQRQLLENPMEPLNHGQRN